MIWLVALVAIGIWVIAAARRRSSALPAPWVDISPTIRRRARLEPLPGDRDSGIGDAWLIGAAAGYAAGELHHRRDVIAPDSYHHDDADDRFSGHGGSSGGGGASGDWSDGSGDFGSDSGGDSSDGGGD